MPSFDGQHRSADSPELTFRFVSELFPKERKPIFAWPGRFGLALHTIGPDWLFTVASGAEFYVDASGRSITCHPGSGGWTETAAEAFVRRILPRIVQLHGRLVLHAAVLDAGAGCILICGRSGAGKSTLALHLHQQLGWRVLGDDMAILGEENGCFRVFPSGTDVSLWPESREALEQGIRSSQRLEVYGTKHRCHLGHEAETDARPILGIFHLGEREASSPGDPVITELKPGAAVALLAQQAIRFNPPDRGDEARRFHRLAQLAGSVSVMSLSYERSYTMLPRVGELLLQEIRSRSTTEAV